MSQLVYQIVVLVHLLSAIAWVGGTLFLVMVMVPLVRSQSGPPSESARLLGEVARRFRPISWAAVLLLILTGLYLATEHWGVGISVLFGGQGWFINVLQIKVGLVAVILVLSAIHDFIVGPRLSAAMEGVESGNSVAGTLGSYRKAVVWLARANLLLILMVLALAVTLSRGSFI